MLLAACLCLCLAQPAPLAGDGDPFVVNGDFEQEPRAGDPVPGWTLEVQSGGDALPTSIVESTSKESRGGRRSLRLAGDYGTRAWLGVVQALPVRPGAVYRLSAQTKTAGVKREGAQVEGCSLVLTLYDAAGAELGRRAILPGRPRERWTKSTTELLAPPSVREARLVANLSMSGELWIDDVELALDGGWDRPGATPLLEDRFDREFLGPDWYAEFEGQGRPSRARLELDGADGGPATGRVAFTADDDTGQWVGMRHDLAVGAYDTLWVSAQVRGESHGDAPPALRMELVFVDALGVPLGGPADAWHEQGDGAWRTLSLVAVAPPGATGATLALGLRTVGRAWLDDLLVLRESGAPPPFLGWLVSAGDRVRLHMPPGHPLERRLKLMQRDLERLAEGLLGGATAASDGGPVDVWVHRDAESCRAATGWDAPHVDPATRSAHVLDEDQARAALESLLGG